MPFTESALVYSTETKKPQPPLPVFDDRPIVTCRLCWYDRPIGQPCGEPCV